MSFHRLESASHMRGALVAPWVVPLLACDVCAQTWGHSGVSYPAIDLRGTSLDGELRAPDVATRLPRDAHAALTQRIRLKTGVEFVPPGTTFGPLGGSMSGAITGLMATMVDSVLANPSLVEAFEAEGFTGFTPRATNARKPRGIVELELVRAGRIASAAWKTEPCVACGDRRLHPLPLMSMRRTDVPDLDLFRLADAPGITLVSERLRRFVEEHSSSRFSSEPIALSDE